MTSWMNGDVLGPATHLTHAVPVSVVPEGLLPATTCVTPAQSGFCTWHENEPPWLVVDCVSVLAADFVQLVGTPPDHDSNPALASRPVPPAAAAWLTVKVWPAIVMVPVRALPVFG